MKKSNLLRLKDDISDEEDAVHTYKVRQKQIPRLKNLYSDLRTDEKRHKKLLTKAKNMPISQYFKGRGSKVMKSMKKRYGDKKGKSIFYATANKNNMTAPSDKTKKRHGLS